ncbi:MAG TPA: proline--tRNA ligase [Phycisphaerales bacterium]|nr:proline--tRNA ligase [Phycisphaerales bacterium]HMP36289.1 proline--tRNA ligase [Phycisphaerales bacterium]
MSTPARQESTTGQRAASAISPTRAENYAEWYQQVVRAADLAETSPVRGCMVIKPWGWAIWENIQRALDAMFKETGHRNAYFPLFIPLSFLQKEADHVEGFAKECAVVTHHRLEVGADGKLVPAPSAELDEPLIVRPTSETIIGASFAKWVQSYRDLPLLINQWANVVRWEMRTRLFLRTAEFLWQEGHTAHATSEEAVAETMQMLGVYARFARDWMAMPVVQGEKTAGERFPGAVNTYSIEAMMQDRKALQAGTSHFLGQNFSRASEIVFLNERNEQAHAWTTSWGVSTRLVGGLIMTHSDDDGLVVPPRLAPAHVVVIPVAHKAETAAAVTEHCRRVADELRQQRFAGEPVRVELDARDMRGGDKAWQWIKRGVPVRVEIGPRDMEADSVFMARRDRPHKEKSGVPRGEFVAGIAALLQEIQDGMLARATAFRDEHTRRIDARDEFDAFFTPSRGGRPGDDGDGGAEGGPTEIHGGFALSHFCGDPAVEAEVKERLGVTVRCIPLDGFGGGDEPGRCVITGRPSERRVVWAKSY